MSSSKVEGWLETKIGRAERWERKWVVFDEGILYFSTQKEADRADTEAVKQVPMDRVISLRTDVRTVTLSHITRFRFGATRKHLTEQPKALPPYCVLCFKSISLVLEQDQYGDSTIQIVTREHKLYIRAISKDEVQ